METQKRILLVLGGTWHDFDGFTKAMTPVFEASGYAVTATYDLETLVHLHEGQPYDVVALYTCLGGNSEEDATTSPFTDAQADSLVQWVRDGGALLAVHAATVAGQSNQALKALMGGAFKSHPPQFSFTVYPMSRPHPVIADIEAFAVHDEFYLQDYDDTVDIHMVALDRGVAHPMVWTKVEGLGRVVYVAMGHDAEVWTLQPYRQLMQQALAWLTM